MSHIITSPCMIELFSPLEPGVSRAGPDSHRHTPCARTGPQPRRSRDRAASKGSPYWIGVTERGGEYQRIALKRGRERRDTMNRRSEEKKKNKRSQQRHRRDHKGGTAVTRPTGPSKQRRLNFEAIPACRDGDWSGRDGRLRMVDSDLKIQSGFVLDPCISPGRNPLRL